LVHTREVRKASEAKAKKAEKAEKAKAKNARKEKALKEKEQGPSWWREIKQKKEACAKRRSVPRCNSELKSRVKDFRRVTNEKLQKWTPSICAAKPVLPGNKFGRAACMTMEKRWKTNEKDIKKWTM